MTRSADHEAGADDHPSDAPADYLEGELGTRKAFKLDRSAVERQRRARQVHERQPGIPPARLRHCTAPHWVRFRIRRSQEGERRTDTHPLVCAPAASQNKAEHLRTRWRVAAAKPARIVEYRLGRKRWQNQPE